MCYMASILITVLHTLKRIQYDTVSVSNRQCIYNMDIDHLTVLRYSESFCDEEAYQGCICALRIYKTKYINNNKNFIIIPILYIVSLGNRVTQNTVF